MPRHSLALEEQRAPKADKMLQEASLGYTASLAEPLLDDGGRQVQAQADGIANHRPASGQAIARLGRRVKERAHHRRLAPRPGAQPHNVMDPPGAQPAGRSRVQQEPAQQSTCAPPPSGPTPWSAATQLHWIPQEHASRVEQGPRWPAHLTTMHHLRLAQCSSPQRSSLPACPVSAGRGDVNVETGTFERTHQTSSGPLLTTRARKPDLTAFWQKHIFMPDAWRA